MKMLNKARLKREFRTQVCESRTRLYRTAYSWCHNPDLADDLVQQTICKALEKYSQLRDIKALNGWLFTILYRCFINQKRFNREVPLVEDDYQTQDQTPDMAAGSARTVERVRAAISTLSLAQRQAITLVDLEGFSYAEVASILDIPVGTVMSRLSRGRRVLHKRLIGLKPETQQMKNDEKITSRVRIIK